VGRGGGQTGTLAASPANKEEPGDYARLSMQALRVDRKAPAVQGLIAVSISFEHAR